MDEALTEQVRAAMPYAATLGLEVIAASKEEVHASVQWDERLTTAAGILHGGVVAGCLLLAHGYILPCPTDSRGVRRGRPGAESGRTRSRTCECRASGQ